VSLERSMRGKNGEPGSACPLSDTRILSRAHTAGQARASGLLDARVLCR
jgi:hypothetical protein